MICGDKSSFTCIVFLSYHCLFYLINFKVKNVYFNP